MKFLSIFLIALLLIQAYFTSAKSLSSVTNGGGHSEFTQTIDCSEACSRRCSQSSRQNECHRACKSCCARCNCVPPGTYGNKDRCPCYANLKTHENKNKCP